ncbi:P1 family peptidase [Clostridium malenominatum]|uniref:P1 family peptidase n=1 Tax=Clostridium malenominatum TaxID=1539 RepID=A0ABP3U3H3_9CLOT
MREISLFDIEGICLGHAQNYESGTGCSAIICTEGATGGVDVRGGAPGTRETDLLNPVNMIEKIHAVVLSGGSAFGLDSASGVMKYLEDQGVGFDVGVTKVPIVCSAVLFDLTVGNSQIRPDKNMGYEAALNSEENKENLQGNIGAGTGATVGKMLGPEYSMKGGLGSYCLQVGELKVGALIAVNCLGDVIDPSTGEILAGAFMDGKFVDTESWMIDNYHKYNNVFQGNTTIGVVVTNGTLSKSQANKIASMAHNGYGRTMRPAHTMFDGDTIFTMATGKVEADINLIGMLAARVVEKAVINAVKNASSRYGIMAYEDLNLDK